MAELLLDSVKRVLYKNGQYIVAIPRCDTSSWTVTDWIKYIDLRGTWVV